MVTVVSLVPIINVFVSYVFCARIIVSQSTVYILSTLQKRKEREAAILKNSRLTEDQKKKWLAVMTNNFMSSEESWTEDSIVVHPLPWRTEYVNKMFRKIDAYCESKKSPQAKRQTKRREYGMASSRPEPDINEDLPRWAVNISTENS